MYSHKMKQFSPIDELNVAVNPEAYTMGLFRRAVLEKDIEARQWVQRTYWNVVVAWLRAHAHREFACRFNTEDFYITQAFEQLWCSATARPELMFDTLPEALRYLQASLNSVLVNALRDAGRSMTSPNIGEKVVGRTLWETLCIVLQDVREQRLAYLLYNCGFEPREILEKCPEEFCDLQEILRLRRKVLLRLMREPKALSPWLENGQLSV
jgi:hypothetical protein